MRTLSSTLQAAQAGSQFTPYVRVTRRRMSAWEDRYSFAVQSGPGVCQAVSAGGGVLNLYYIAAGVLYRIPYTGIPPTTTGQVAVTTTTDTILAAAQQGASLAVCHASPNTATVTVHISQNGGQTWATESVSQSLGSAYNVFALACAWNNAGTLAIAAQGTSGLWCTRRTSPGFYTAPVQNGEVYNLTGDGAVQAEGIAMAYSKQSGTGDWLLLAGGQYAGLWTIAACVLGDGDTVTQGTLTAHAAVLATQPYKTTTPTAPGSSLRPTGACLSADTVRAVIVEAFENPQAGYQSNRNYLLSCQSAALCKLGAWRDPQALPVDNAAALLPAFDPNYGGNPTLFLAYPGALYYATQPATQDLSSRVLHATKVQAENGSHADVVLDNADGSLSALAQTYDTTGEQLTVDFGYTTAAGNEYSAAAPLFVHTVHATSHLGLATLELQATDSWGLLANWRPRRMYNWITGQSTVEQILQWILARCGIPYVAPATKSALLTSSPAFNIRPGDSGALAVHDLLDMVPEVLWFTAQGATLRNPQVGDPSVYSYQPQSHPVQGARLTITPRALNHVLLYGKNQALASTPSLLWEALDTADTLRVHDHPLIVRDMQVALANTSQRAGVPLRKAQLLCDTGELAAAPNAGLEVWDVIAVSGPLGTYNARVRELQSSYSALVEGGEYTESVGLMNL